MAKTKDAVRALRKKKIKQIKKDVQALFDEVGDPELEQELIAIHADEVLPADPEMMPVPINLTIGATNILSQLEQAGYVGIVAKLRELQTVEGIANIEKGLQRIKNIEKEIDRMFLDGAPMGADDLKILIQVISETIKIKAQTLLLPHGTMQPKDLIPKQVQIPGSTLIPKVGGGGTIMPRRKV